MPKITAPKITELKNEGKRIVCITAYDFTSGKICDEAGADLILVGDSLGNVILGYETTIPVTLSDIQHHVKATKVGVGHALLVADLPFGTYNASTEQAMKSATTLMQAGAEAVKLEGDYPEIIKECGRSGIPVMGHVGFTPQSVNKFGGFKVQGRDKDGQELIEMAQRLDEAGAFAIVLELMPAELAKTITEKVSCATIGIGAGIHCDGEIQVFHDVMGFAEKTYKHTKKFVNGYNSLLTGMQDYVTSVRDSTFPTTENSF